MVEIPNEREYLIKRLEEINVQLDALRPNVPLVERAALRVRLSGEFVDLARRLAALAKPPRRRLDAQAELGLRQLMRAGLVEQAVDEYCRILGCSRAKGAIWAIDTAESIAAEEVGAEEAPPASG